MAYAMDCQDLLLLMEKYTYSCIKCHFDLNDKYMNSQEPIQELTEQENK